MIARALLSMRIDSSPAFRTPFAIAAVVRGSGPRSRTASTSARPIFFFLKDRPPPKTSPLPLHDPLPISRMTHASIPASERERAGVGDGLIRLSIGVEDVADLIADLESALA